MCVCQFIGGKWFLVRFVWIHCDCHYNSMYVCRRTAASAVVVVADDGGGGFPLPAIVDVLSCCCCSYCVWLCVSVCVPAICIQ